MLHMKIIAIPAQLRFHVSDGITDEQIQALINNATSEGGPSLLVQGQMETHLMDVASAEDVEIINGVDIHDVDVWVYCDGSVDVQIFDVDS